MNISLTPELERFVQEKVNSGMYTSASEVIRESLRLLYTHDDLQRERIKQLNNAIDVGLNELSSDKKILAKETYERMKQKISKIAKGGK
ncbi:TPA: type II toxin-antitoxin system ParD family antitoxin [Legionella pneumophila]|uniref:type II toxin-antitoxin system ParD family antitoxin n=1 Tax=Fluoribacter gormanii TaxID=464 RepID=UPI001041663B|nr:type II toxin-antitoxin system ParD family antitoxin [Fluoribacter gormanii]HBD7398712.1 type II toxin-antitoxin system ParD family antitoxin [Legionella pneumophila]